MPQVFNKYHRNAPPTAIYIGRPTKWGNPFVIGKDGTREEVIRKYEDYLQNSPELLVQIQSELRGKDLICFCYPNACHGDVLLKIANGENHETTS